MKQPLKIVWGKFEYKSKVNASVRNAHYPPEISNGGPLNHLWRVFYLENKHDMKKDGIMLTSWKNKWRFIQWKEGDMTLIPPSKEWYEKQEKIYEKWMKEFYDYVKSAD